MSQQETKEVPGFTNKRGGGYTGEVLKESVKAMVERAEKTDKEKEKQPASSSPKAAKKTPLQAQPKPKPKPQMQRVGFKKITITIPEDIALTILNYAGHSSKKSATLDVWYAEHKEPQIENPLPVYPLANLYQPEKIPEQLVKSK